MQLLREREELKYSAEEKIVEDSDESEEDENIKKSVAERREQIQKRLSIERPSAQKKEIVQEITAIKRQSLIEDKKALHEEEIIMHAPTDNIIKSTSIPEQIIKLKSTVKESPDVSKTDFDKELQDKFKTTIKGIEDFEHKASDELQSHIQQTVQIESSKSKTDSKIYYDSTKTEKSSTGSDDKYAQELITEKTTISDETSEKEDSVKKTVTTIDNSQPKELVKTVDETAKTTSEIDQKIQIDSKLLAERIIDKQNDAGKTQAFLEQEIQSAQIYDQNKIKIETNEAQKTSSIIEKTKDFLESEITGKPSGRNEFVVTDVVVEKSRDSTTTGEGVTLTSLSKEIKETPLIDTQLDVELEKHQAKVAETINIVKPEIKVSKDVFTRDTNEDEFFKTIEAKITKKMSQDLTLIKDDIAAIGRLNVPFKMDCQN